MVLICLHSLLACSCHHVYIMFGQTTRCRMLYSSPLPSDSHLCMYVRMYIGVPMFLTVYTHCYASRVTLSLTQLTNKIITVNVNRQLTTDMLYSIYLRDYLSDMLYAVHVLAIIIHIFLTWTTGDSVWRGPQVTVCDVDHRWQCVTWTTGDSVWWMSEYMTIYGDWVCGKLHNHTHKG